MANKEIKTELDKLLDNMQIEERIGMKFHI